MSIFIVALLISSAQAQPAVSSPAVQREIVVLGGKLKRWAAKYEVRGTRTKCSTRKSSGDAAIDAIGCASFKACLPELQPRIDASDKTEFDRKIRLKMKAAIKRDLSICVTKNRDQAIADLAERRWQARQRSPNATN